MKEWLGFRMSRWFASACLWVVVIVFTSMITIVSCIPFFAPVIAILALSYSPPNLRK